MKRKIYLLAFCSLFLLSGAFVGQTVFAGGFFDHTFGGPVGKYTRLNEQDAYLVGARGGWVIENVVTLGFGYYGIMNDVKINTAQADTNLMNFGYGGLVADYIFFPDRPIHAQIHAMIGGGFLSYRKSDNDNGDMFYVVEPGVDTIIKAGSFADIAIGVSYRYIWGVKPTTFEGYITNDVLSSFSFNLGLLFD